MTNLFSGKMLCGDILKPKKFISFKNSTNLFSFRWTAALAIRFLRLSTFSPRRLHYRKNQNVILMDQNALQVSQNFFHDWKIDAELRIPLWSLLTVYKPLSALMIDTLLAWSSNSICQYADLRSILVYTFAFSSLENKISILRIWFESDLGIWWLRTLNILSYPNHKWYTVNLG